MPKQPHRRCVVCRRSDLKTRLGRVVRRKDGIGLVLDEGQKMPGRGAYVHLNAGCVAKMCNLKLWKTPLRFGSRDGSDAASVWLNDLKVVSVRAGELVSA